MAFYSQFADYYLSIFPFNQTIKDFLKSHIENNTTTLLDIGCATGHYTASFVEDGLDCLGIDLDPNMIAYARQHYPASEFLVRNMIDIKSLKKSFDLIFCIGNTAAHLTQKEFDILIKDVYNKLNPEGKWIFQVRNWDYVIKQKYYEFPIIKAGSGKICFTRSYSDIKENELFFNTRLTVENEIIFHDNVKMFPISSKKYIDIHKKYNFDLLGQFSDFRESPYESDLESANVFVFQKNVFRKRRK